MSQTDVEETCCFYSISRDFAKKCQYSFLLTVANAKGNYELETYPVNKMVALNNVQNLSAKRSYLHMPLLHIYFFSFLAHTVFCTFANTVIFIQNFNEP